MRQAADVVLEHRPPNTEHAQLVVLPPIQMPFGDVHWEVVTVGGGPHVPLELGEVVHVEFELGAHKELADLYIALDFFRKSIHSTTKTSKNLF